jgi:uncharacterized protein YggE
MIFWFPLFFVLSLSAFATDDFIQVQGRCSTKVTPDRVMVTFTAENTSKDQKEAFKKTNRQIEGLKADIKKLNLEKLELKNTGYNVYPVQEYLNNKVIDKGIRVSLSLEVTTSQIERIGEVMVSASKIGITNVGQLATFLSLEKTKEEYLKCLDVASDDAKAKARQLSKKLDIKLAGVVKVVEAPMVQPAPIPFQRTMMAGMAKSEAMEAPKIEAGQQEFTTSIDVYFGIK